MRLWSIHPRHLDARGLVALWREGLLARAVLRGRTRGYRHHPQLERFRARPDPLAALDCYLSHVLEEARGRGYQFDASRIRCRRCRAGHARVTAGQLAHEWEHLLRKLWARDRARWTVERSVRPQPHPCFRVVPGGVAGWERAWARATVRRSIRLHAGPTPLADRAMPRRPSTVDEYLVTVTGQRRAALARLRMTIRALLPEAEECISYGMPAFRLRGRVVAGFAATAGGGSYYPFSGATLATLAGELGDRGRTKSALHFRADDPLPASLVRKLLQARMAEIPEPHGAAGRAAKGARSAGRKGRERGT